MKQKILGLTFALLAIFTCRNAEAKKEQTPLTNNATAEEIIRAAISSKANNRESSVPRYSCERYEKLNLGWINLTPNEKRGVLLRYFRFLFENTDTTDISGKAVDFVLSKEMIEDLYYEQSGHQKKSLVKGINREWIYSVLHEQGLRNMISEFFNNYSIYDNHISFLNNSFVSPLSSSISGKLYKYTLADTVEVNGVKCYKIDFEPANEQFLAFRGSVFITSDTAHAVAGARYYITHNANLNFIDTLSFKEQYQLASNGKWMPQRNEVSIEMSLFKLFIRRINSYQDYSFDKEIPATLAAEESSVVYKNDAWNKSDEFWVKHRHFPVTNQEDKARQELARFIRGNGNGGKNILFNALFQNVIPLGKFEYTPVFSTFSSNDIEGLRIRMGGTTTAKFNKHLFAEGYGAYGNKDKLWKYAAKISYSFPKRKSYINEYPAHDISLSHSYDLRFPGQELISADKDNVFLSFRRAELTQMLLERKTEVKYRKELYKGISYQLQANHRCWQPVGNLIFRSRDLAGNIATENGLNTTEIGGTFRVAVGERFYQNRNSRVPLSKFHSVFTFSHTSGIKGLLSGDYAYHLTETSMQHTLNLCALGYAKMMFKAGKQWSKVPFPLLIIPQANQSYLEIPETYNLMNVLEFANDQYASFDLDYHLNGLILNWLPVNKHLKMREVFTFKSLVGSLSDYNNPDATRSAQWLMPTQANGQNSTFGLGSTPYMEAGVGVENIFSLIRLDYVWRLTYRNNPNTDKSGIRIGLKFQF